MGDRYTGPDNGGKSPGEDEQRAQTAKAFLGLIACVLGLLLAVLGLIAPLLGSPATAADVSLQAVGAVLGIV